MEKKEKKKIMYIGYAGDKGAPYDFHGVKFTAREVQPVTDDLFEAVRHVRGFVTVETIRTAAVGFKSISGIPFGDINPQETDMVF